MCGALRPNLYQCNSFDWVTVEYIAPPADRKEELHAVFYKHQSKIATHSAFNVPQPVTEALCVFDAFL